MTMPLDEMLILFRLASRELFNQYFHIHDPYINNGWEYYERFKEVEKILFQKMVTEPSSIEDIEYGDPHHNIIVQLRDIDSAPIMINRGIDSGYWDYPITQISKDIKMIFINFFDWDQLGYRDYKYVKTKILGCPFNSELSGKQALIEVEYVRFAGCKGPVIADTGYKSDKMC
jgi:hypothetical protein